MTFEAMEEAAAAGGETSSALWSASTNWIVAEGSLDGSVVFDTAADDGAAAIPGGALLLRPPSQDSLPCEITVFFKEKHDIHMVYVRSTARIYEIYYASDRQNHSKDYLCTVRCGATAKEGTPPNVTEGATTESPKCNDGTMEAPEQTVQGDSNSSDEDGWVQVKVPDSPMRDGQAKFLLKEDVGSTSTNFQIHYEATAEISDASPCVSLTLRLLSLQTKTCVHVEEIYIYADPVESTNPDSPGSMGASLGGTSLLAMLVPSLLHFPKSGTSRIHNSCLSDDSGVQQNQDGAEKAAETSSPDTGSAMQQEAYSTITDQKLGLVQEPTEVQENTHLGSSQKVKDSCPVPESVIDENNLDYRRVEKVLDELVSRVGRIEAFCSRFEENMMKPLGCIEMRLQGLEQQLDAFVTRTWSSERFPSSRIAAPEFSFDDSDSENKDCNTTYTGRADTTFHGSSSPADDMSAALPESQLCPGLIVKAPEFFNEVEITYSGDTSDSVAMSCSNDNKSVSIDSAFTFVPESRIHLGLAVKAPEFLNEDDEPNNSDDTLDLLKDRSTNTVSIDGAIALSLEKFLTSSSIRSPNPSIMDVTHAPSNGTNCYLASSAVRAPSEGAEYLLNKSDLQNHVCDIIDSRSKRTAFCVPSSFPDDVAAPENLFDESDMENRCCDASDVERKGTVGDSSLLADDVTSPVFASETSCGLVVMAPEFPIEDGDFVGSDDDSDSNVRDCLEDQEASPTGGGSASALAVFLSSMMAKSSNCRAALIDGPSELSNGDRSELASSVGVPCEGADNLGGANLGNNINGKVDLDLTLNSGPPEGSLEQNERYKVGRKRSSVDAPVEGSTSKCRHIEDRSEQKNRCCDASDDSSLLADDVTSPVLAASKTNCGLVVMAPEFPIEDGDFLGSDDASDSQVSDCLEDRAASPSGGGSATALAVFLSSMMVKSSNCSAALIHNPSELSNGDRNELVSSVEVPCEGANDLGMANLGNNINGKVDLALTLNFGPPEGSLEQNERNKVGHKCSSVDAPVEGSTSKCRPFKDSSEQKNRCCDASDVGRKGNVGDSSLLADNVTSPVFASQASCGLVVMAPEFPIEDGDFVGSDDSSDSHVRDCLEDQAASPTGGGSASALAVFLSSMMVKSSNCSAALTDGPSELSNGDRNDLTSSVGVPCEGSGNSGWANQGKNLNGNVDLDLILNLGPPGGSLEQDEHYKVGHKCSSLDAPVKGSTSKCRPVEDSSEQKDYGMEWHEWSSNMKASEGGLFTQDLLHCTGVLNGSINDKIHNCHNGDCADDSDSDTDEAAHGGPSLNQLGRGWTVRSMDSSFNENFIKNKVQIEWLDGSSTDSYWGPFTADQSNGQAAHNSRSIHVPAESTINHRDIITGMFQPCAGSSHEKSYAEIEQALRSMLDYPDPFFDENIVPVRTWRSGVPLEILLGEMSIGTALGDDEDSIATGLQGNPSPPWSLDQKAPTVDQLLLGVEDLTSCFGGDVQQGPGSSNQEQFSSLI